MFSVLIVTLCFTNAPCEQKKLDIYQNRTYCDKMGIMEAAKASRSWPDGFIIKDWHCNDR